MKLTSILLGLLFALTSCGGGGSGSSSNFGGSYLFETSVVKDECLLNLGTDLDLLYRVDQDGDRIVVRNLSTNATATGNTVGNGWFVSSSVIESLCTTSTQVAYSEDIGSLAIVRTCPTIGTCTTEYAGIVTRD